MRELPVVEGLRARITNETADQRPLLEGASLRLPFRLLLYQLLSFHSTKTFVNVSSYKGSEISLNSFQKFWKLLNFRNANHPTENSRNSGSTVEGKENRRVSWVPEVFLAVQREFLMCRLGIPPEVLLFFKILELLATKSRQKFTPDFLVEWKAPCILCK